MDILGVSQLGFGFGLNFKGKIQAKSMKVQGKVRERSRQGQGIVRLRSRQGHGNVKAQVKTRSGQAHGMEMQVQAPKSKKIA